MAKLELYISDFCPFCHRVLRFMEAENISDVEIKHSRSIPDFRSEVSRRGGKYQVPLLMIDDEPLYESSDIIDYLGSR